jgi:hypothetical protein
MSGGHHDARGDEGARAALAAVVQEPDVGVSRVRAAADDGAGRDGEDECAERADEGESGPHGGCYRQFDGYNSIP